MVVPVREELVVAPFATRARTCEGEVDANIASVLSLTAETLNEAAESRMK